MMQALPVCHTNCTKCGRARLEKNDVYLKEKHLSSNLSDNVPAFWREYERLITHFLIHSHSFKHFATEVDTEKKSNMSGGGGGKTRFIVFPCFCA